MASFSASSLPALVEAAVLDPESQACQDCHAMSGWEINDPVTGRLTHLSIGPDVYAASSHASVPCRSCHDWGYDQIPHRGSSEHPIYECVFCHDGDPAVARLRLSDRKRDLQASVHGDTRAGPMDCHSCHDPHAFRPVNESDDPLARVARSNALCLQCHGAETDPRRRFVREDAAPRHRVLPNYANHIRKVKCVACHTAADDPNGTRHGILKTELSLRACERCHTPSSPILDAIYGPQDAAAALERTRASSLGGAERGAYVIGSSRSPGLERLSVFGFGAACLTIVLHALARAVYALRRRRSNGP